MRSLSPAQVLLFGTALAAALVVALFPYFPRQLSLHEGDRASRTIRSPRAVAFESELLTEQRREEAANAVQDVREFDADVAPRQQTQLTQTAASIAQVRGNADLSDAQKRARLLSLLPRGSTDTALALPPDRWQRVTDEAQQVLTATLGEPISEDGVQTAQDALPQQISPDLAADEANLVADLVRPLIVPTFVVDEQATNAAREAARQNVQPVQQSIAEHQVIVEEGQPIDATTLEVLEEVGLLSSRIEWDSLVAVVVVAVLVTLPLALALLLFPVKGVASGRHLILLALLIALPVLAGKVYFTLVLPDDDRHFLAYFLPLATAPMLVATLLEARLAALIGLLQAVLMTFVVVYLPDLSLVATAQPLDAGRVLLVYGLGALLGVSAGQRAERANQYVLAGGLVAAAELAALFALWLLDPDRRPLDAAWMVAAASVSGLGSGLLTAGSFSSVAGILGVTTRVQLMELAQLNAPLLRRLQDEAPGTFHHSVIVGNLAERAADLTGADALLVRVGCYYHDIGKIAQPGYYIENQLAGDNPHDELDPKLSGRIIAQHVQAGLELARRYGLPPQVQAFIPEHHGTRLIPYFYRKASQQNPDVAPELFRYPGPKPQSRETAIVMLADSTEATVRASADRSPERIDALVDEVVADRLAEGELEECDLTLRDLRTIAESFKQTLRGVYHPRIAYPEPTAEERRALIARFRPGRRAAPAPPPEVPASSQGQHPTW